MATRPLNESGYSIRVVASETGIPAETLRIWERRYDFPRPSRRPGGACGQCHARGHSCARGHCAPSGHCRRTGGAGPYGHSSGGWGHRSVWTGQLRPCGQFVGGERLER